MQVISKNSSSHIFTVETLTLLIWLTGDAFNSEKNYSMGGNLKEDTSIEHYLLFSD